MSRKLVALVGALALVAGLLAYRESANWYRQDLSFLKPTLSFYMRGDGNEIQKQVLYAPLHMEPAQLDQEFRHNAGRMELEDYQQWTQGNGPIYTYRDLAHDEVFEFTAPADDSTHQLRPGFSYRVSGLEALYARLVMLTYAKKRA